MTYNVTRSPARLWSRDGKLSYYGRLEYDFLVFVPCFLLLSFSPSLFRYVYLLRVPSSVQQSSATLSKYVVRVHSFLCHLHFLVFEFLSFICLVRLRSSCFSGGVFAALLYPALSTWFAYVDTFAALVFLCLTICDHRRISISLGWRIRKDTGGTADVG